ncbi:hypothetical protein BD410DRAFT_843357 [Rickenella mellea]|uniref:Uncharacterized protein n=1 Tax=Rickenella mellea TaxID=50990 RepID=A0A4Y7PRZ2_9AGAM|nr:hypothetical protein BD410DRAFT_843357 [Rickenella mellea]
MPASSSQNFMGITTSGTLSNGNDVAIELGGSAKESFHPRVDSDHEPLLHPGADSDPAEKWDHPKLSGYRAIFITLSAGFGTSKAIRASMGHSIAPTALECIFVVVCTVGLYWLGLYEASCPRKMHWLFKTEYWTYVAFTNTMLCAALIGLLAYLGTMFTSILTPDFDQEGSEPVTNAFWWLLYTSLGAVAFLIAFPFLLCCYKISRLDHCPVMGPKGEEDEGYLDQDAHGDSSAVDHQPTIQLPPIKGRPGRHGPEHSVHLPSI